MIKLSYILPLFNVEKYIADCLDSIFSQNVLESDYEVICVDDCSPDGSKDIVKKYQREHNNLILLEHTVNKRMGGARNTGLRHARGEHIWFVDTDDMIADGAASLIIERCEQEQLDVLCFNYTILNGGNEVMDCCFKEPIPCMRGIGFIEKQFGLELVNHMGYVVRAVYRRSLLVDNDVFLPEEMPYGEDTTLMMQAIAAADRVAAIPEALYRYRQNDSQVSIRLRDGNGKIIYYSIIGAGEMILQWREEIAPQSTTVAGALDKGIPWFVNRLLIRLIRTSHKQRKSFYGQLKSAPPSSGLVAFMNRSNRLIVKYPPIGAALLDMLSIAYRIKHK